MKRRVALFTAFLKVFSACSTVHVSPASAYRARFIEVDVVSPRPINRVQFGVDGDVMGR